MDIQFLGSKPMIWLAWINNWEITKLRSPIDVARINDWVLRAAAIKGEYHWHFHSDDELFLVYKGQIVIETEKGSIFLKEGQEMSFPKE